MQLRRILIGLGALIAILPYLGFPSWIDTTLYTLSGLAIIFLLTLSKRGRVHGAVEGERGGTPTVKHAEPKELHVKRREVEEYPEMHVEKETTLDTEHIEESPGEDTTIEKKVTVVRTKRRRISAESLLGGES